MGGCVSEEDLLAYVEHTLEPAARKGIEEHLAVCGECREVIAAAALALTSTDGELRVEAERLAPGVRIGRYVLGERLGAGGAGVVHAAQDPELKRHVAIKLVRPLLDAEDDGRLRDRMRREAQAMARVRHPNVVAVFDVGEWQDRLFIAMELVAGTTLQGWLRARRRSWREVVATFRAAGAGLAAAHAAGIVHRDFKPANVLVGEEGRVCVTDFGLAATGTETWPGWRPEAGDDAGDLTRTGALLGTPRYMAPEQFSGGPIDARTDVFAFSVALFEALHGAPPFTGAGDGLLELARAVAAGDVRQPRGGPPVPAWLDRVVARGLRPRPEDRYPSMRAMLAALGRDPRRTAWRLALAAAGVLVTVGVVAFRPTGSPCDGGSAELAAAFGPERLSALRDGLLASGVLDAPALADRTLAAIDAYSARFGAEHREACEATRVRGVQSEELLDVRMECLAQDLRGLSTVTDLLAHADAVSAAHALDAVLAFDLADCAEPAALIGPLRPRREVRDHPDTAAARALLAQAQALASLTRAREGIEAANAGLDAARRQRYGTLEAELLLARGNCEELDGRYRECEATLSEALWTAEEAHDDAAALRAAGALADLESLDLADLPAADRWARLAWSKLLRLGFPPSLEAVVRRTRGNLALEHRAPGHAEIEFRRGLALAERVSGHDSVTASDCLSGLGLSLGALDRIEESIAAFRGSIAVQGRLFGPDHVNVTSSLQSLGFVLMQHGRAAEALPLLERALELRRRVLGERNPDTLRTQQNHAQALLAVGRVDEAIAAQRFVLAEREAAFGPRNDLTVASRMHLARFLRRRGDFHEAVALYRAAYEAAAGSWRAADAARELAALHLSRGQLPDALAWAWRLAAQQR